MSIEAVLDAIEADEPRLNAVATLLRDRAMSGGGPGPLQNLPVAVKDLFAIAGVPTKFGADPVFWERPVADSAVVARLEAAGAIIVATSQMLEFAYGALNPGIGQTNNPVNPQRTAGGSSGGLAALVAAGHVRFAVGTDTGGSIRIPASYCGIVGMKPTHGLVPLDGALPLSWTLDHAGPLTRNISDARTLLAVLAGRDMPRVARPVRGLRLGVLAAHRDAACITPDVRAAFDAACEKLARAGAVLHDVGIPELTHVSPALMLILLPEATVIHAARLARAPDRMADATRLQLDAGAAIPATAYVRALQFRRKFSMAFAAVFGHCDAVLSPTVAFVAPAEDPPMEEGGGSDELLCSAPANLAGLPAITLPCGWDRDNMPIGLQLTGAAGADAALLDIAEAIEAQLAG